LQAGQKERRGLLMERSAGQRYMQTFKNDPTAAPSTNANTPKRNW
jgi:hypothetical protein